MLRKAVNVADYPVLVPATKEEFLGQWKTCCRIHHPKRPALIAAVLLVISVTITELFPLSILGPLTALFCFGMVISLLITAGKWLLFYRRHLRSSAIPLKEIIAVRKDIIDRLRVSKRELNAIEV